VGVFLWAAGGENFEFEGLGASGQVFQHQLAGVEPEAAAGAVEQHPRQVQVGAVEAQRLRRHCRVAPQLHAIEHAGFGRVEV